MTLQQRQGIACPGCGNEDRLYDLTISDIEEPAPVAMCLGCGEVERM